MLFVSIIMKYEALKLLKTTWAITEPISNWRGRGHRKANLLPAWQTFIFGWLC